MNIIRTILLFVKNGKKKKTLDSPEMRKKLESESIDYTPAKQEYNPDTGEYTITKSN